MKRTLMKWITTVIIVFIITSVIPQTVTTSANKSNLAEMQAEKEMITLELEEVVNYAIDNNYTLLLLRYQLDAVMAQLESQKEMAKQAIDYVPPTLLPITACGEPESKEEEIEDGEDQDGEEEKNEEIEGLKHQQCELQNSINLIINQQIQGSYIDVESQKKNIDTLENEMSIQNMQYWLEQKEIREGIKLRLIQSFIQLETLSNNIALQKLTIGELKKEMDLELIKKQHGMVSKTQLQNKEKEWDTATKQLNKLAIDYDRTLRRFLSDANLDLTKQYQLSAVNVGTLKDVTLPKDLDEIVKKNNKMVTAERQLANALTEHSKAHNTANYSSETLKEKAIAETLAKRRVEEIKVKNLEKELTLKVIETYEAANDTYQDYVAAEKLVTETKQDQAHYSLLYERGFISKKEYDTYSLSLRKAEIQLKNQKLIFFMHIKSVEAIHNGYIQ